MVVFSYFLDFNFCFDVAICDVHVVIDVNTINGLCITDNSI